MGPYHVVILHNTKTDTHHLMPFRPAPRPSDDLFPGGLCRHKSIGHHTDGFPTLQAAEDYIAENREMFWPTGVLLSWTGEGVPNMILDFPYLQKISLDDARPHQNI